MSASDSSKGTANDPDLGRRNFLRHSVVSLGATVQAFVKHSDAAPTDETP